MASDAPGNGWVRREFEGLGVYLRPDKPEWVAPNSRGDFIFSRLIDGSFAADITSEYGARFGLAPVVSAYHVEQFFRRLPADTPEPYGGRRARLKLDRLRELWIHITNRCNASCAHCMFACSPGSAGEAPTALALDLVRQARDLGCELFYFTGGEPFLHPRFLGVCEEALRDPRAHVVVLTNATLSRSFLPKLADGDRERLHFQVSVDGGEAGHDALRGQGAYRRLLDDLRRIVDAGFPVALAMAVSRANQNDMPGVVSLASELGVGNVHYLWLFERGGAESDLFVPPEAVFPELMRAAREADARGVRIDNLEILKSQVFSIPGTRFDLSNAGWQSLAVAPDGGVYPSPALIGHERAFCGGVDSGLETVWRESERLDELRRASLADVDLPERRAMRFLVGGEDVDHSLTHGGAFTGHDPYVPLYERAALALIAAEARRFPDGDLPGFRLRMGEWLYECGAEGDGLFFTHSNCVLSLPGRDGHAFARDFYARAAEQPNADILNPSRYDGQALAHVPEEAKARSYGCGSPVADAGLDAGDVIVDLGCGAGMECFIAAEIVGPTGRVIGVDMLPPMLERARRGAAQVSEKLGYANVEFRQGLLEDLPLEPDGADVVLSNCVLNLSPHKRRAFAEILRVLKPGGRLVIADVSSDAEVPIAIQYNEKLRGECLGGALRRERLFEMLADLGFRQVTLLKRVFYREVRGHRFQSITYSAVKPTREEVDWIYRGPFAAVVTDDGRLVRRGERARAPWLNGLPLDEAAFVLDADGAVVNVEQAAACCASPPEAQAGSACDCATPAERRPAPARRGANCMVCGEPLVYLETSQGETCHFCGQERAANAVCVAGHFVCDACHSEDALRVIERVCANTTETDLVALLRRIRQHEAFPVHGPEHHALVPAIIVTAFRNAGGQVPEGAVRTAVERGETIAGGACGFMGVCGAASGVGAGFGILLGANPLKGRERRDAMRVTAAVLDRLSRFQAARCCQRDCWIALQVAAELSKELLPFPLRAEASLPCEQFRYNRECLRAACPLWPKADAPKAEAGARSEAR